MLSPNRNTYNSNNNNTTKTSHQHLKATMFSQSHSPQSEHLPSFIKFQRLITSSLLKYKSILNPKKISRAKPNFSGNILIQFSEETGFQAASMEIYRMLLKGKIQRSSMQVELTEKESERPHSEYLVPSRRGGYLDGVGDPALASSPHFELFLPRYILELTSWTPKSSRRISLVSSSLLAKKVIRLVDVEGRSVMLRGETQEATYDLWHYLYSKGAQTTLPNYIKKREKNQWVSEPQEVGGQAIRGDGGANSAKNSEFYLINHQITNDFNLVEVSLEDSQAVKKTAQKWLFDLNVDLIDNLAFERTSGVFIQDGKLLICKSKKELPEGSFLASGVSVETLVTSLDQILLIFKNLRHRNVFFGPEYNLGDIAFLDGEVYFKGIEKLRMTPERQKYDNKTLKTLLKCLTNLMDFRRKRALKRPIQQAVETIIQAGDLLNRESAQMNLDWLIGYLRTHIDLDEYCGGYQATQTPGKKIHGGKEPKLLGLNSLDLDLTEREECRRRAGRTAGIKFFDSAAAICDVQDEGVVENHLSSVMEIRQITFKNKFMKNR